MRPSVCHLHAHRGFASQEDLVEVRMDLQKNTRDASVPAQATSWVLKRDGSRVVFDEQLLRACISRAAAGYEADIDVELIMAEVRRTIFSDITTKDIAKAVQLAACTFIERDPAYGKVAARLLLQRAARDIFGVSVVHESAHQEHYRRSFIRSIEYGVSVGILDARMASVYDLASLAQELVIERDDLLDYMGVYTLYERYFVKYDGERLELPQCFWMRIAMGLCLQEECPQQRAVELYEVFSTLRYIPSTPTLFHSGFPISQLSSCYLNTVGDDLSSIFKCLGDNAQMAKWAGGLGTDWTPVRGTGSLIKSIRCQSQGVIPYLKIANDTVVAITRSGIRRGGKCAYLEAWHIDFEDFLDLRRNTGDERRRAHDMNTAAWVPDLFMKRVIADGNWTYFSPDEVPDLHETYGKDFERRYEHYESLAAQGLMRLHQTVPARSVWRKMLTRLFETGHPWITFKDPCNVRSPQDHVGVVHSSNLCTEITLNTSATETAVCNLGSINVSRIVRDGVIDQELLRDTVRKALRALDNVIDLNFYPTEEGKNSNQRHRPVGLGMMGFQDLLYLLDVPFSSPRAAEIADELMELISYYVIDASCDLAREKGAYATFAGSKWDRGLFPLDTVDLLQEERGVPVEVSRTQRLDWASLKAKVKQYGMRNSNTMAIAPTATIATIAGCYPSIEPIYKNIYVKSNVTGEFTVVNSYLVQDLKKLGLWTSDMIDALKYYDGSVQHFEVLPESLREKYRTAFELDAEWLIQVTAERQKWIDQSTSHNVFLAGVSGKKLDAVYQKAWRTGMKTCYYLRTLGATQIEKATLDAKFGFTQKRSYSAQTQQSACSILNGEECESCQ